MRKKAPKFGKAQTHFEFGIFFPPKMKEAAMNFGQCVISPDFMNNSIGLYHKSIENPTL